jgi:hypothetical protein
MEKNHPLRDGGFHVATTDIDKVLTDLSTLHDPNAGFVIPDNVVMLDIDVKRLPNKHNPFLETHPGIADACQKTLAMRTPSGGGHYFFSTTNDPLRSHKILIAEEVEMIWGIGTALPPSKTPDGAYEWTTNLPIATLPDELLELWTQAPTRVDQRGGSNLPPQVQAAKAALAAMPPPPPETFPPIQPATKLNSLNLTEPPQVIRGLLHQGHRAILGAPSKARKSWVLIDVAIAVALGKNWLGFNCNQGPVLYIDYELDPYFTNFRINEICRAHGWPIPEHLDIWNLRGKNMTIDQLLPEMKKQIGEKKYSLIIPDPIYKTQAGRDENSAGDVSMLVLEIEKVAIETGAAVLVADHFAKGLAANKEVLDRISGSGVKARAVDTYLALTPHEEDDLTFTLSAIVRNFPPVDEFVVRFKFPFMEIDPTLDPTKLKTKRLRPTIDLSLAHVTEALSVPMTLKDWKDASEKLFGVSRATFYRRREELFLTGVVEEINGLWQKKNNPKSV